MDFKYYLNKFQEASTQIDKKLLVEKKMDFRVGIWLNSVVIKMQKKHWANPSPEPFQAESSIFFSVWVNDKSIKENKILYNIHAFKLRKLNGYSITSRDFAVAFRKRFSTFEQQWPNVIVDHGPLTLMEGWQKADTANCENDILELINRFLKIDQLIDNLLDSYKTTSIKKQKA